MLPNTDKYEHLFCTSTMKLSQYAKQQAISCPTALQWWQTGLIKGYQAPTGTMAAQTKNRPDCPGIASGWRRVMNEGSSLLSQTQLKERGWTPALMKKFLGPPAATKPNPHYQSAALMRLYTASRVEVAERSEDWKQTKARAAQRSEVGKVGALRQAAASVKEVERLPITVNYIRHHLTEDETHLEEGAGGVGVSEAALTMRRRIYDEIAAQDPDYAEECQRQMDARYRGVS